MSCSSKRKTAAGSCMSTLVSSTNARRAPFAGRFFDIGSEFPRRGENFGGMSRHAHLAPLAAERATGIDEESASLYAHHLLSVHVLLLPHPKQHGDRMILVRTELERELHLVPEAAVGLERVRRDAEDPGARAPECACEVAEVAAFQRAAGRVVARVEVDDHVLAALATQAEFAVRGRNREFRCLRARLARCHRVSSS